MEPEGEPRNGSRTLAAKLTTLHQEIRAIAGCRSLSRIAVAIYDPGSDLLKTFIHSSDGASPLDHYSARLAELPSLLELARTGRPRVIDTFAAKSGKAPAVDLSTYGFRSSYTVPVIHDGRFHGFVFFNSFEAGFFTAGVIERLAPYAQVITMVTMLELSTIRMLRAAVTTVREITRSRDEETGGHLERMSRFARLIALRLAPGYGLTDEFVEFIFQFSPLHDLGKVGIPDAILLKPGRLDAAERRVMKTHVAKGRRIVELLINDFDIDQLHVSMLKNVVAYHHEALDGSGYPFKLTGDEIPLEARIIAVADVFDALTSARPYKQAWSTEAALDYLRANAGTKYDGDCVAALAEAGAEIAEIQARFAEPAAAAALSLSP